MHMPDARRAVSTTQGTTITKRPPTATSTPTAAATPTNTNSANPDDGNPSIEKGWLLVLVIVLAILALALIYLSLRTLRSRNPNPKYLPPGLKLLWNRWNPRSRHGRAFGSAFRSRQRQRDPNTAYEPSLSTTEAPGGHSLTDTPASSRHDLHPNSHATQPESSTVNRNTSIRSIMTLPPYHPAPLPSERLIAREGERAGVDTVLEFPETAEEEEAQREEDMEALYQIRQARRRELEEREARRDERRVAREQGDWARLETLRLESQARARARAQTNASDSAASLQAPNSATMFAEHAARAGSRDRRVSSVSYAALGVARHDGSRIRADSVDSSDERPLLDSAASMGGGSGRGRESESNDGSRRSSYTTLPRPPPPAGLLLHHSRNFSTSSAFSHDEDVGPVPITPAGSSQSQPATSDRHGSNDSTDTRNDRNPRPVILTPASSETSPRERPPEYDLGEAPPYVSPTAEQRGATSAEAAVRAGSGVPQLPPIRPVPSIEVTVTTPITPGGGGVA